MIRVAETGQPVTGFITTNPRALAILVGKELEITEDPCTICTYPTKGVTIKDTEQWAMCNPCQALILSHEIR